MKYFNSKLVPQKLIFQNHDMWPLSDDKVYAVESTEEN